MRDRRRWHGGGLARATGVALLALAGACDGREGDAPRGDAYAAEAPPAPPPPPALPGEQRYGRLRPDAAAWVDSTLASLSLRERVAQLVVPWISGASPAANPEEMARLLAWVERDRVGGLIVSTGTPRGIAAKLDAAQARARVPLLVVSDLETGPGMRLTPGGTDMPPAMAFGAAGDTALAREAGRITGIEARAVGIHLTLGPVLDVNSNPRNPIINVRSFGEDPQLVARLGSAWIQGARESGLLAAGKHFPGHGDTHVDSHVGLPTVDADAARLRAVELVPFAAATRAGLAGMLVGHIAVPALAGAQPPPASLSPEVIGEVLRREVGFQGLAFTDALNMGGVTNRYSVAEASIRALLAGADVLLQPPGTSEVIDQIVRAVESGRVPAARVDEAARRMLTAKAAAGLHRGARVPVDSLAARVGAPAHDAHARQVARRAITLARDPRGLVPFPADVRSVLYVAYATRDQGRGRALAAELEAAGLRVERSSVGPGTGAGEFARLRERARASDAVLISAAIAPHQYRSLGLSGGFAQFVESLSAAGRPVVVVSLGSPYLLDAFPSAPAYLLGWSDAGDTQRAVARALTGAAEITGRLPVSLPPHHRAGEGIRRTPRR